MKEHSDEDIARLYQAVQLTRPLLRHITAGVEAKLQATGLSVGQRAILEGLLLTGTTGLPELTAYLQLKRQFIHKMLGEVIETGLVEGIAHPTRKNGQHYRLSKSGEGLIRQIRDREVEAMRRFASQCSPEEIRAYAKLQSRLNDFFADMAMAPNAHDGREAE